MHSRDLGQCLFADSELGSLNESQDEPGDHDTAYRDFGGQAMSDLEPYQRRAVFRNNAKPCAICGETMQVQAHTRRKYCDPCEVVHRAAVRAARNRTAAKAKGGA